MSFSASATDGRALDAQSTDDALSVSVQDGALSSSDPMSTLFDFD
jgi:hypothetical protein